MGGSYAHGCTDKTLPTEDRACTIPYKLYFARKSGSWGGEGIAFIETMKTADGSGALARMWKITTEQFEQVKNQEGRTLYNESINLGTCSGLTMWAITSKTRGESSRPSPNYVRTIILGLVQTHGMDGASIFRYLYSIDGIKGFYSETDLRTLVAECVC